MTYYRKRKPVHYDAGTPTLDTLPRGTLTWADDPDAVTWMDMAPVIEPDRVARRTLPDGRTVTGHLWLSHVAAIDGKPYQVTRIVWDTGQVILGRIYGAMRDGLRAWAKFKASGRET